MSAKWKLICAVLVVLLLGGILMSVLLFGGDKLYATGDWLQMSGNKNGPRYVVDADGKPFRLFGIARCQYHEDFEKEIMDKTYGRETDAYDFAVYYKNLGMNCIRYSIYYHRHNRPGENLIEECGGFNEAGINKYINDYVNPDLQKIMDAGMYVILDMHEYPHPTDKDDPNPAEILKIAHDEYIPLWIELAKRYKDEPRIAILELWNEPYAADQESLKLDDEGKIASGAYKGYDWNSGVVQFFIDCVAAVRKYDTRHIILVSDWNAGWGSGWAKSWKNKNAEPKRQKNLYVDGNRNIIFSVHANNYHINFDGAWYDNYWYDLANKNNIGLHFGEVELEGGDMDAGAMSTFIKMLEDRQAKQGNWLKPIKPCNFSAVLWRPHLDDETDGDDYASIWSDFAKVYANPVPFTPNLYS